MQNRERIHLDSPPGRRRPPRDLALRGEDELLDVIASLYDAASEIVPWSVALAGVVRRLESRAATLFSFDRLEGRIVWLETTDPALGGVPRGTASLQAAFLDQPPSSSGHPTGRAIAPPERPQRRSQALAPAVPDGCRAVGFEIEHGMVGGLALQRSRIRTGAATERRLAVLIPHLQRALRVHWRRYDAAEQREAELEALGRLSQGLILLSGKGEVIWRNQAVEAVLAEKDGLLEVHERLRAARPEEDRELQERIAAAADPATLAERGALAVTRPSLRRSLWLALAALRIPGDPFAGAALSGSAIPAVVIFVSDPERSVEVSAEYLREAYGLTPAEARLAAALAQGLDLDQAAARFGITKGTARIQLKAVFAKTGTHSQADLIRLLVGGLGVLARSAGPSRLGSGGERVAP